MASNIIQAGVKVIDVVTPSAVNAGDLVIIGQIYGIALTSAAANTVVSLAIGCTARLRKVTGTGFSFAAGDNVFWHIAGANATTSATGNVKIGVAGAAVGTADTAVNVHLNSSF